MEHTEKAESCRRFYIDGFKVKYSGDIKLKLVKPDGSKLSNSEQAFLFKQAFECSNNDLECATYGARYLDDYEVCVGKRRETLEFLNKCAMEDDECNIVGKVYVVASGIDDGKLFVELKKVKDNKFSKNEIQSIFWKAITQPSFNEFKTYSHSVIVYFTREEEARKFINHFINGESLESEKELLNVTENTRWNFWKWILGRK